ncbi:DUF4870 domain-containing protein [Haloterrigena sp. SYSU A121-1]|uniref:DUF4870 domain-containing protein n=1 Tax=Haloterrigena gelatinilytica TaxID=2741724 RepID=A0A8J8KDR1_9EURY|nr:DUF4870 domain-containing protein [Haloterrigena gelatinilytica]NUB90448.1 DUF4870 domain-containing protein [Haloterrigena gelatinilytica]
MDRNQIAQTRPPSKQNSVMGILVHLIGLFFSLFGSGIVYILARNDFTKKNAQNSINWHIFLLVSVVCLSIITFTLGDVFDFVGVGSIFGIIILILLNALFCLWATFKALQGQEWIYPVAPRIVR